MSRATLMQDLFLLLAIGGAAVLLSLWGLVFYGIGYKRGVNDRPDRLNEKWREEHFLRKVADERVESQEQVIQTLRMALQQTVQARDGLALVERRVR